MLHVVAGSRRLPARLPPPLPRPPRLQTCTPSLTLPPFHHPCLSLPQWAQAVADGTVNRPAVTPDYSVSEGSAAAAGGEPLSLGALMSFSGPAPELINGR